MIRKQQVEKECIQKLEDILKSKNKDQIKFIDVDDLPEEFKNISMTGSWDFSPQNN